MTDITERDANCKNCLHVRVCTFRNSSEDEKICSQFTNKADAVEPICWIDAKTNPPTKQGKYLCAIGRLYIDICSYALNLEKVDKHDFYRQRRSGWYQYDNEYGYFKRDDVTHYMPLPELPKEE